MKEKKLKVNFFAPIGPTGYGIFARYLAPAIARKGVDLAIIPIYGVNAKVEPEVAALINKINEPGRMKDSIGIKLAIANPFDGLQFYAARRIYYNMLEVDKLPETWVETMNQMDDVWTPSHWGKKVFENSGINKDVKVVPGGVDLNIFNPYREPLLKPTENFRFLAVGKWEIRKGYDLLCKAFAEEFSKKEKVELVLASSTASFFVKGFNIFQELFKLRLPADRPDFTVVSYLPDYKDMGRLYNSADCFVMPTRGEGWNLPLTEAMACGLPSITTNWSGQTEYLTEKNAILLEDFELKPARHPNQIYSQYLEQGRWAEPSLKELKEKMRYAFDNREEIKKTGKRAAKDMKNWTWDKSAEKVVKALK